MSTLTALDLDQPFDAIVVGSGPGGATVARELVRDGRRLLILERGHARPVTGSMPQTLWELMFPGRGMFLTDHLLSVLRGVTVGGSSIYFWGTAWEPPYELFERRGVDIRNEVAETKRELKITPLPPERMGPSAHLIMDSARRLGFDWRPLPKFFNSELLGGPPMGSYGAPSYEAKWNARMYIDQAVALGGKLLTGALARRVLRHNGSVAGVEFRWRGRMRTARAPLVVVAAGGIGSAVLLRASGFAEAGTSFFCDPLLAVMASRPGPASGAELPMTGGVLIEDRGYMLTDMSLTPWVYAMFTAQVGRMDRLFDHAHSAAIMVKIKDDLDGRISERGWIRKPLTGENRRKLEDGAKTAAAILREAGATHLYRSGLFAAHPGGTAPIGRVVDSDLQTEVRNLYVCDASVIPDAWGLPPTLTLIGLGKRLARHLTDHAGRSTANLPATPSAEPAVRAV